MTDFKALYECYAGDVYRFAYYLSGNEADAAEITAETFSRALIGRKPIVMATVKAYLLVIAKNLYLESLRKRKRLERLPSEVVHTSAGPMEQLEGKSELQALLAFLEGFPATDRSALLLRADGLPYRDIAAVLNISEAAAKVKVHRLRLKLVQWRLNH